jgi:glutaredoxin-like YruB-family protein
MGNDAKGDDAKKVIVYSTNWCAYCKMAKKYLGDKGIAVIEKNIEEDPEAHKELMEKIGGSFRGVPVIDIAGTIIFGFDRAKIDAALKAIV